MPLRIDCDNRPGLLVSVRDDAEALAALAGGAHVIDVKEPDRGSLGAAERDAIAAVIRAVAGRAPVTAAAGELLDLRRPALEPMPQGVTLFKLGLSGCRSLPDWKSRWSDAIDALWPLSEASKHVVAVAYADWQTADAPEPRDVLHAAIEVGAETLLVDTWRKSEGALFNFWPPKEIAFFMDNVQSHGLQLVLAGSLTGECFASAARLRPDLLAVRTAACELGRGGTVSQKRVAALLRAITDAQIVSESSSMQV
jgi:uncharacterized protein (UPF0264 family)